MLTEKAWRGRVFIKPENEYELDALRNTTTIWREMKAGIYKGWWCE